MSGSKLVIMCPAGESIGSVEEWFAKAPPTRGAAHWQDDRSAKELAKAWCHAAGPAVPSEVCAVLGSSPLAGFEITLAKPEHQTRFDALPGGARNHDLLLLGRRGDEKLIVGVEAKAGEPLDATVAEKYERAMKARADGTTTNLPERILALVEALFGKRLGEHVGLGELRYQLLTATAGTLVEAKAEGATAAVLLIHEFGRPAREGALSAAQAAIAGFLAWLGATTAVAEVGVLYGPFMIHGGGRIPADIPFYVGLVRQPAVA